MRTQAGFTLIELVMVIVIMGILAAVAVPQFVDLSQQAQANATIAQAASANSANVINFADRRLNGAGAGTTFTACTNAMVTALMPDFDGTEYTVSTVTAFPGVPVLGDKATCRVTDSLANTSDFTGIYVP